MRANNETAKAATRDQSGRCSPAVPHAVTRRGAPAAARIQKKIRLPRVVSGEKVLSRTKKVMSTGTMVMANTAAAAKANVLV